MRVSGSLGPTGHMADITGLPTLFKKNVWLWIALFICMLNMHAKNVKAWD